MATDEGEYVIPWQNLIYLLNQIAEANKSVAIVIKPKVSYVHEERTEDNRYPKLHANMSLQIQYAGRDETHYFQLNYMSGKEDSAHPHCKSPFVQLNLFKDMYTFLEKILGKSNINTILRKESVKIRKNDLNEEVYSISHKPITWANGRLESHKYEDLVSPKSRG